MLLWYNVVKYDKSIEDDVCSFGLYCTVFNLDGLDTLTPHCCLNVTGGVSFSFYYFTELDNVAMLCISAY